LVSLKLFHVVKRLTAPKNMCNSGAVFEWSEKVAPDGANRSYRFNPQQEIRLSRQVAKTQSKSKKNSGLPLAALRLCVKKMFCCPVLSKSHLSPLMGAL
jgi:hypothetical protein